MPKTITITRSGTKSKPAATDNVLVSNRQENWSIDISCQDDHRQDLELAKIILYLPGGKRWTVTIQDLMHCFKALENVKADLIISSEWYSLSADTVNEVDEALKRIK